VLVLALAGLGGLADATRAAALDADLMREFARAAGRVVHARCVGAEVVIVEVAGARLAATEYSFAVHETLKGEPTSTLRFRQVGTPSGGPRDLGQLVGLPVYRPGQDYLLFMLPAGRSGLTSPAGAGEAAFGVEGSALRPLAAGHLRTAGGRTRTAPASAGGKAEIDTLAELRELMRAEGDR
jgi:hypothetical protein